MWLAVLATTLVLVVNLVEVAGQKTPTISFISGAGSGEVVTDLGKKAELTCQVMWTNDFNHDDHNINDIGRGLELFYNLDFTNQVKNGKEYPINWIKISGDKKEEYE